MDAGIKLLPGVTWVYIHVSLHAYIIMSTTHVMAYAHSGTHCIYNTM